MRKMPIAWSAFAALFFLISGPMQSVLAQPDTWLTTVEKTDFRETPRYAETMAFCQRLADVSPMATFGDYGTSPQGRRLPLLVVDVDGLSDPQEIRRKDRQILLVQNAIHPGESDGKDASLILMRDIAISGKHRQLLQRTSIVFLPIFNVDGHENFGPYNRANQNGPEQMGFRATAQNVNLNRDYLKADAPEMQAWLAMYQRWQPDFLIDNHVTDGSDHQYVLTYGVARHREVSEPLRNWTTSVLEPALVEGMAAEGYKVMRYFSMHHRPDIGNGINIPEFSPRYSTGFGAVRNRIFLLVETHTLKDYRTRVMGNYQLMVEVLRLMNRERAFLHQNNLAAERESAALTGQYLALRQEIDFGDSTWMDFAGKAYRMVDSEISGNKWVQFSDRDTTLRLPVFGHIKVTDSTRVPYAYLLRREWPVQLAVLKRHGLRIRYLEKPVSLAVESYRFKQISWRSQPFEGRHMANYETELIREERHYPAGTAVIVLDQPDSRVACHLLEPGSPDSFIAWGFWNGIFERKEYAEDYVLEEMSRKMLSEDPALEGEFRQWLKDNPKMAENYWARLYFFYAKTPYYEDLENVYPVGRLMETTTLPLRDTLEN